MPSVELFLTYATYKIVDNKAIIHLFGRTLKCEQICVIDRSFEPFFLVKAKKDPQQLKHQLQELKLKDGEESAEVLRVDDESLKLHSNSIEVFKVIVNLPSSVPIIKKEVVTWDLVESCYEYDIRFASRYILAKGLTPLTLIKVQGDYIKDFDYKVPVLDATEIVQVTPLKTLEKPRVLAIDLETYNPQGKNIDMEKHPIVMASLYGYGLSKVIVAQQIEIKDKQLKKDIECVDDEAQLLKRTAELINDYAPDIITGYSSDIFDMPYLRRRAQKAKVDFSLGLDNSDIITRQNDPANIIGIAHIDIFRFIRRVIALSMKTDRFTLEAVSQELLGEGKVDVEMDHSAIAWDNKEHESLELFAKYNLKDSVLAYRLHEYAYPLMAEFTKLLAQPIFEVSRMSFSQFVEHYIMKKAVEQGEIIPNRPVQASLDDREGATFEGAYVYKPTPGLYQDLVVLDFRSLYPTILASHNVAIDTLNCDCCKDKNKAPGLDVHFCTKKKGFLSSIMEGLIELRKGIKQQMKTDDSALLYGRSQALKYLCNSFYGYLGYSQSRWYCLECSAAITAWGRHYIHNVIEQAKTSGFGVVYGDTDSVFLQLGKKKHSDAMDFIKEINKHLPGMMELELQGFYPSGIFVAAKGSEEGAKKRYALLGEKGEIKIAGFETVRRNTSPIAKEVQKEVLRIILSEKDAKKALKYVQQTMADLRAHKIPVEKVAIFTQLTRPIEQYESIGPHVAAAMRMKDKGQVVTTGSYISYIVCKGKGKIRDKVKLPDEVTAQDYDPEYYINNQVLPAVERIFDALGTKEEDIEQSSNQSSLGKFF